MTIRVCGNCEYYACRDNNRREGACMAMMKQIDGKWGYHPERVFNRYACGFFKEREIKCK